MRLKAGDLFPHASADLNADVSGATVRFRMTKGPSQIPVIDALAVADDPVQGLVHYAWQAGDTDDPGAYQIEWRVTFPGSIPQVFAQAYRLEVVIKPAIGVPV